MLYANSSSVDNSTYSSVGGDGGWTMKMTPVTAILATLGGAGQTSAQKGARQGCHIGSSLLQFPPKDSRTEEGRVRKAALVLFKEKGGKLVLARVRDFNSSYTHKFHSSTLYIFSFLQDPMYLDRCVVCWEQGWEDCFEVQDFQAKEACMFKVRANSTI